MRLTQRRYSIVQWSASASNKSDFDERPGVPVERPLLPIPKEKR
jgi:hypothetical protein